MHYGRTNTVLTNILSKLFILAMVSFFAGCGGGGSASGSLPDNPGNNSSSTSSSTSSTSSSSSSSSGSNSSSSTSSSSSSNSSSSSSGQPITSTANAVRFLNRATFGAKQSDIDTFIQNGSSTWFKNQLAMPVSYLMPLVLDYVKIQDEPNEYMFGSTTYAFWRNVITGEDQLRQRMAFALSEIFVVSNGVGDELSEHPESVSTFEDILIRHAFGNYRDLIEDVTYSPAMGYYLTYMGNLKGDDTSGRKPDENYAREILQLFSIGVAELNLDGTEKLDSNGKAVETYNNDDIQGLAKVFTGLNLDEDQIEVSVSAAYSVPMMIFEEDHSTKEKRFLSTVIPANTKTQQSIDLALDAIFNHANVAPFIGKQLIQRLVTSNPSPEYVSRVAQAFNAGTYTLPDGSKVGSTGRGDLTATLAAVLFDSETNELNETHEGKIREPIIRFSQWARAFDAQNIQAEYLVKLWDTSSAKALGQHPYRSPSVFNFFRPGYQAPGSFSGAQGLVAPELQITNATSIPGYINFMTYFIFGQQALIDVNELDETFRDIGFPSQVQAELATTRFMTNYAAETAMANDPTRLLNHLDLLLTGNTMSAPTKNSIINYLNAVEDNDKRVKLAVLMVMSSPDYLVQL